MKYKVSCPVCNVSFFHEGTVTNGDVIICPVCGARLQVVGIRDNTLDVVKAEQKPKDEILERIEAFARQNGFIFNEDKEIVLEGLLQKKDKFGDFFCPCRYDNISDNLCPCLETRMGQVVQKGHCHCGLFNLKTSV